MKNWNEIDDNINELIMSKSFEQLSADEKNKALEYAGSEEEYNSLRQTLLAITSSFSNEEDDFAADIDMKDDLVSQFEKKYGTKGNRDKIVPLYRKPYFQLAVAASLALLVFFSVPMLRNNEKANTQIAQADITDSKNKSAGKKESPAAHTSVNMNKPDIGSGETYEKSKTDGKTAHVSIEEREDALSADMKADRKAESTGPFDTFKSLEKLSEKEAPAKAVVTEERPAPSNLSKGNTNVEKPSVDEMALYEVQQNDNAADLDLGQRNKKSAERAVKNKEDNNLKKEAYTYNKTDHTNDSNRAYKTNSTAGVFSSNTNPVGVTAFMEDNKTEMLDMLFTTY